MAPIYMTNTGNIVSPNGAAIIFGAETNEENAIDITVANDETYNPYNIVIVEEDTDESIPAEQITFSPNPGSSLTGETVQTAINELEQAIYNNVPIFTQEVIDLNAGASSCSLSKSFSSNATMVFYNGILINSGKHYSMTNSTISFSGFSAEAGDILTVIGLAASGGNSGGSGSGDGTGIDAAALIGGSY